MSRSSELYLRAVERIPGGVNSPVRAFGGVGGHPFFVSEGKGPMLTDVDGTQYIDYVMSWGALLLGHAHPRVVEAVQQAASRGTSFGAPTEAEVQLAERICSLIPCAEQVRLVSSGTEATMSALRLARAATQRRLIVKFAGCYHGHSDSLLANAGSGIASLGIPGTPGVTEGAVADTAVLPFNDLSAVEVFFAERGPEIAAVIVEPVAANMGVIAPQAGFLESLRRETHACGALLVFDEVVTGFRLGPAGACGVFGIQPDLVCLGKALGAGLPIAAFAGRADIMNQLAPSGSVYQAGTLSGNPLATAAALAFMNEIEASPDIYRILEDKARVLEKGLHEALDSVDHRVNRFGSMLSVFFTGDRVVNLDSAKRSSAPLFARLHRGFLDRGVFVAPSALEAWFVSTAHTEAEIEATITAVRGIAAGLLTAQR